MSVLEIQHLHKSFGPVNIINDLSFQVPQNSIFGFIGQNGAGKTTTMKMVLGLLKPDAGSITVCGEPVHYGQTRTNRLIGYLPDVPEFYNYYKPVEYLRLCGEITGMSAKKIKERSEELLSLVGLEKASKRIGGFSRGMKQRLGIAQALLNEPKLLICDEPTSALDPLGRKDILDILQQIKGKTTVVFSTHILSDVERICDHIALLNNGRLTLSGTPQELKSRHRQDSLLIEFVSVSDLDRFTADLSIAAFAKNSDRSGLCLTLHTGEIASAESAVIQTLARLQILPIKIEVLMPTIETLFMEAVQE